MSAGSFSRTAAGNRAYVASVSVRFRSKEKGARVKDREENGASLSFFRSLPFLARKKPKISFFGLSLLRSETRKHSVDTQSIPF